MDWSIVRGPQNKVQKRNTLEQKWDRFDHPGRLFCFQKNNYDNDDKTNS
jgi:hypothetical protein